MTIRPASISARIVLSLRTTGAESIAVQSRKGLKEAREVSDYRAQMAMAGHNGHQLKRIVLPSGKTIEVVYFDQVDRPAATNEIAQSQRTERELHVCEHCESDLVYPTTWEEADEKHWSVSL